MFTAQTARILRQSGILLIGAALVSAEAAWLHMRELMQAAGVICGGSSAAAHCPACYASALLLATGVAAFVLAQSERPARLRARSARSA